MKGLGSGQEVTSCLGSSEIVPHQCEIAQT